MDFDTFSKCDALPIIRDNVYVQNVNTLDFKKTEYQECGELCIGISIIHSQCENQYVIYSLNTLKVGYFMHLCATTN